MSRLTLFALSAGACALAVVFFILSAHESAMRQFYADALWQYGISTDVSVGGRTLSVHSGQVTDQGKVINGRDALNALQISYARTLAERSPLFALPGTSPSDLSYAVSELRKTSDRLAELQQDPAAASRIRTSLYPLDSLNAAALTEEARLDFLQNPDRSREIVYERSVRKQSSAFLTDLRKFRNSVSVIIPDTAQSYIAADRVVSKNNILIALDRIESGAQMTILALNARALCLNGFVSHCSAQDLSLPSLPEEEAVAYDGESIHRARDNTRFYGGITDTQVLRNAPIIALTKSTCTEDTPSPPLFVTFDRGSDIGVPPQSRVIFVGDIRFVKISEYGDLPFYKDLHSRGIEYVLSPPLLHYECMDEGHDITTVLSTRMVLKDSTSTVLYESDAIRQANNLARSGDPEGIHMVLAIKNNSTQIDQLLRDISWSESRNLALITDGLRPDLDATNLFFSRSGFVSLFASNNPSYVGNISLFPRASIPVSKQPYQYLSQVHSEDVEAKLMQDVSNYIILHIKDLLKQPIPV